VHVAAPKFTEYGHSLYGLGFRLHSYRAERVVSLGGGFIGCGTPMAMLPDRGVAGFTINCSFPPNIPAAAPADYPLLTRGFDRMPTFRDQPRSFA
jgi:hypothetical protein